MERNLVEQTDPAQNSSGRLEWQNAINILTFMTVCKQAILM